LQQELKAVAYEALPQIHFLNAQNSSRPCPQTAFCLYFAGLMLPPMIPVLIYYDKAGALDVSKKLVQLARQKNGDFRDLIQKFSDLPQQTTVPVLKKSDPQLPAFLHTAFRLKEGQVSDPIDSPMGYLLFKRIPLEYANASHILISYQGAVGSKQKRTKDEAMERARQVLKDALAKKDFAELAKTYSDGPTAPNGGQLGKFARGMMVPSFEDEVFRTKPGDVSSTIVETPFGYHIIKREE
ncbi:MAG: peptidylprolyl isomerase, partial [SAR324 cluster bacterium]|nr:peptidylprolyl isomerase [SAR324 cluster bacterium]